MNRTLHDQIGLISFFAVLLTFLGLAATLLAPFYGPLLCALSAAIVLWPAHCWIARQLPSPSRSLRAFVSAAAALLLLVGPLVAITISASDEAVVLWPSVREHLVRVKDQIRDPSAPLPVWTQRLPPTMVDHLRQTLSLSQEKIVAMGNRAAQIAAGIAAGFAVNILILFGNILLFEFVLFFLLRDGDRLFNQWNDLVPFPEELKKRLHRRAGSVIQGVCRGILIVGFIQTAILAIAYLVAGVRPFVLISGITAISTLIPGIGVGLVWIPLMVIFFIKGIVWKGVTLAVFGILASTSDNIVRPLVAGPAMDLPLLWLSLSLLGGLQFFGGLGILLGPMIFALLPILLDAYRAYLKPA